MKVKAIVTTGQGGPEVLKAADIDLAWPQGPHDVLIELRAAALNPADIWFRKLGGYITGVANFVLGHDGMGIVKAVGTGVTTVKPGDRVCFCFGGIGGANGTYAEAAVVPADYLAKVPDSVDDLTAAALPLVAITGWESFYTRADVRSGEHVLVHGGAGGTGHVAIQLAALRGARVAATVSSAAKAQIARDLGAELAINYRDTDFAEAALKWSGGLHVALDNAGPEVMQQTFRAMAPYGRIVTLMGTPADDADLTAYLQNLSIHNVMMLTPMWKGLVPALKSQAQIVRQCLALVAEKKLKIRHAATFSLADVAKAHELLESGQAIGKVTLRIG